MANKLRWRTRLRAGLEIIGPDRSHDIRVSTCVWQLAFGESFRVNWRLDFKRIRLRQAVNLKMKNFNWFLEEFRSEAEN